MTSAPNFRADINWPSLCEPIARIVWGDPSQETAKELRWGTHGARCVDREHGRWFDHENNVGGGALDLVPVEGTASKMQWLADHKLIDDAPKKKKTNGGGTAFNIIETYDYRNEAGELLYQVCRLQPKDFRQRKPNGRGGWTWKLGDVRRVLYRLPELIEAVASGYLIFIAEGEGKVDALRELGLAATGAPGGAGKWRPEFGEHFRGADVVLLPDNDEPGWKHVHEVGAALAGIAARTRVLVLPGLASKGDVRDWLNAGGTREALVALVENASDWQPPKPDDSQEKAKAEATVSEDELLAALAKMRRGVKFDRQRKKAATQLGVSRSAIDDELEARREDSEKTAPFPPVEPSPDPAVLDDLLRRLVDRLKQHVKFPDEAAHATGMWLAFAWTHDAATH